MTLLATKQAPMVFCVEDETDLREVLVEEIADAGYRVMEASNGKEALLALNQTRPDLILCDIAMPQMGGYELLRHIREHRPDLADVPFIFLTAQDGSGQIVSGKHAGADDYLVKPVNFDLMLATIHARLRQVQRFREKVTRDTPLSVHDENIVNMENTVLKRISKTFDLISSGIVLLNSHSKLLFMNSTAREIVAKAVCPAISDMIVYKNNQEHWTHSAIRRAIQASQKEDDYIDFLSLPRTDGQRDLLLTICALTETEKEANDPVVALFFCYTGRNEPTPIKALEALFQLTPMESRVAWSFAQGLRADEIANMFNISMTTVAFHKRNIFQKTHTNRQADLIALLLTLPASIC